MPDFVQPRPIKPHPDWIAEVIGRVRLARESVTTMVARLDEPPRGTRRIALTRAEVALSLAVAALREAHDEATVLAFVATGEVGQLRA